MPPKRKSPRKPAAVASPAAQVAAGFAKPNLPPLKGTPSARRQYTYGAAVEPPAPRAVQTRRGKLLDLNSAVQNVLEDLDENYDDVGDANVEAQDTPAAAQITPPAPRQPRSTGQGDSRGATPTPSPRKLKTREIVPEIEILSATREIVPEILSDDEDMLSPAAAPRKLKTRKIVPEILSDDEDMRSFAAESDFYEAASMRLSVEPETPRVYEDANEPFVADAVPRRSTLGLHMHPSPLRQSVELDDDEDEESPIQTKPPSRNIRANHPFLKPPRSKSPQQPPIKQSNARKREAEPQPQRGILPRVPILSRLLNKIRGPNRNRSNSADSFNSAVEEASSWQFAQLPDSVDSLGIRHGVPAINWWQLCNPWTYVQATFWGLTNTMWWIHSAISDTYSWIDSLAFNTVSCIYSAVFNTITWIHSLACNTMWWLDSLASIAMCWIKFSVSNTIWWLHSLVSSIASFLSLVLGVFAFVALIILIFASLAKFPASDMDDVFSPPERSLQHLGEAFIRGASTYLSSFGFPRYNSSIDEDMADMGIRWAENLTTSDAIMEHLLKHDKKLVSLRDLYSSQKKVVDQLADILPRAVYLDAKNGRLRISEGFWHILREKMVSDDEILTVGMQDGRITFKPDWMGDKIVEHLVQHRAFDDKIDSSLQVSEQKTQTRASSQWMSWIKANEAKAHKSLGLDRSPQPSGLSAKEIDERIATALKEQSKKVGSKTQGMAVSREEFLRHVEAELDTQRAKVTARMAQLQPEMEKMVRTMLDQAAVAASLSTLQRKEVMGLVKKVVSEAAGQLSFQEGVKGKIHETWDQKLKYQVNYFDRGHGAIVNAKHSTVKYDPYQPLYYSDRIRKWWSETPMGLKPLLDADAALDPWQGEGDCWCSHRMENHRGKPHHIQLAVQLAHLVTPTHIVLEHMLPSASTDPGARPRTVEIYAKVHDAVLAQRVADFAAATMPDPPPGSDQAFHFVPLGLDGFVKIGQFTYLSENSADGVFVHRLDDDLAAMKLATDEIIVRAVDNYGAANHTCFYRVRMYGTNVEEEEARNY